VVSVVEETGEPGLTATQFNIKRIEGSEPPPMNAVKTYLGRTLSS